MIYLVLLLSLVLLSLLFIYTYFKGLLFISVAILILILCFKIFVKQLQHYERAIIFSFGKYARTAGPGWSIVIPFLEEIKETYDIRTTGMKLLIPTSLTKEEIKLKIVGTLYYHISEPHKAFLEIRDYKYNIKEIAEAEVRNLISAISFNYLIANIGHLNDMFLDRLKVVTKKFGLEMELFELDEIQPPAELVEAMQSVEIEEEKYQAQKFRALAERAVIEALGEGAKKLDKRAISYLYVKAIEGIEKDKASKIIFPMEFMEVLDNVGEKVVDKINLSGIDVKDAINKVKTALMTNEG